MVKVVILAAGRGERLLPFTKAHPKPLTRILGKPILEHIINTLKNVGIDQCIIVTGYMKHSIRNQIGDGSKFNIKIHYAHNPTYAHGNATSLKASGKFLEDNEPFLLLMSDHLVDENIVKKALENMDRKPLLCVDRKPRYPPQIRDATRVLVGSNGFIMDIGKDISSWNAIDTGVFLLNGRIFKTIEQMEKTIFPLTLSQCVKQMIRTGNLLWACDVSGNLWLDIDTVEDLALAERLLGEFSNA